MSIKFKHTVSSAFHSFRKTPLLIIGLSLALAMVSVLNIYSYNVKLYEMDNFKRSHFDMAIFTTTSMEINTTTISELYPDGQMDIQNAVEKRYAMAESHEFLSLSSDTSILLADSNEYGLSNQSESFAVLLSDPTFFTGSAFSRDFQLVSGRMPQDPHELIIDVVSASYLGLIENYSNPLHMGTYNASDTSQLIQTTSLTNETTQIVGIYVPLHTSIRYTRYHSFSHNFFYSLDSLENINPDHYIRSFDWKTAAVLGIGESHDFTSHPLLHSIASAYETLPSNDTALWNRHAGIGFQYDRTAIPLNKLNAWKKDYYDQYSGLYADLEAMPNLEDYRISDSMGDNIDEIQYRLNDIRFLQIMNVPLLICIILIGQLLIKTHFSGKMKSFHQSMIQGYPRKMIVQQLLWEIVYYAFSIGMGSILFSRVIYHPVQEILNPSVLRPYSSGSAIYNKITYPSSDLPFSLNLGTILFSFLLGFLICGIIYLKMIHRIKRLRIYEVSDGIEQMDLNPFLTENTLLNRRKKSKRSKRKRHATFEPINAADDIEDVSKTPTTSHATRNKNKNKSKKTPAVYKTNEYYYGKTIKHYGLLLFGLGCLPLGLIFLMRWGLFSTNDSFVFLAQTIYKYNTFLTVISFFMPILMIFGIIRWITFEKPIIYAKLCDKFTRVFVGEKGLINGLETLRYRNLKVISIVLAITSGLFIFANMSITSTVLFEPTLTNVMYGANVNIQATNDYEFMKYDNHTINFAQLSALEETLCNESYYSTQFDFTQNAEVSATSILALSDISNGNYNYQTMVLSNFSNYVKFAQAPTIHTTMPKLAEQIQETAEFNLENPDSYGVMITCEFAEYYNYQVGQQFMLNPALFPFSAQFASLDPISLEVVNIIDGIPGRTTAYRGGMEIFADYSLFLSSNDTISYDTLNFLVNFNRDSTSANTIQDWDDWMNMQNETALQTLIPLAAMDSIYSFAHSVRFQTMSLDAASSLFSPAGEQDMQIYLLYLDITILIFFLITSIIMLLDFYRHANQHYHGLLLVKGFGKSDLSLLLLAQMLYIILVSVLIGIGIGFLTGYAWTASLLSTQVEYFGGMVQLRFPITINLTEFGVVWAGILGGLAVSFGTTFFRNRRKEYTSFFEKIE